MVGKYKDFVYCELPVTPYGFDKTKFLDGDERQIKLYKGAKAPNRSKVLDSSVIYSGKNYARVVPKRLYVHRF